MVDASRGRAWIARLAPWSGPLLIVAWSLVALRGFLVGGRLSDQHPDLLTFWLPRSCLLGDALRDGRLPLWNPHELFGTPFLADPQSGWLSLLWTTLPTALGCGRGLAAIIVVQPIIAGLGLYAFLRRIGLGRPAATAGGLSLAMLVGASKIAISMPFAGAIAWTPLLLLGADGYLRERGPHALPWLALAALAWGQVAAAHLSHGLVVATVLLVAVGTGTLAGAARRGEVSPRRAALLVFGGLAFLVVANTAILLPHAALLARSSLADGYRALPRNGVWAGWPLALAGSPGAYAGAVVLLAVPSALRDRERRPLVVALLAAFLLCYALTLDTLVGNTAFRAAVLRVPFGDVYLHNPARFRYLAILVAPILGAIGLQATVDRPPTGRAALAWYAAPVLLFLAWPLAAGALPQRLVIAGASALVVGLGLRAVQARGVAGPALAGLLAIELLVAGIWSTSYRGGTLRFGLEGGPNPVLVHAPLREPRQRIDDLRTVGPIARYLRERAGAQRYLAWVPPDVYALRGYLFRQAPRDRPALLLGRAILLGLHDALGYSPVQLPRTWRYVRARDPLPVYYNASVLQDPSMRDVRLLGIGFIVSPRGIALPDALTGTVVAREGGFVLTRLDGGQSRAVVVPRWRSMDADRALAAVLDPAFRPDQEAVVEGGGDRNAPGAARTAIYREATPEDVTVRVASTTDALLVVRNAWDVGWHATLDGEPVEVLRADYLMQGVRVPAGDHVVRLIYRDPTIGRGLAVSAAVWLGLLGAWVRRRGRATPRPPAPPPAA